VAIIAIASLVPANMQIRTGLHWLVEHFLAYVGAAFILCLAWPRPLIVAAVLIAVSALLEILQGLTPDRGPRPAHCSFWLQWRADRGACGEAHASRAKESRPT